MVREDMRTGLVCEESSRVQEVLTPDRRQRLDSLTPRELHVLFELRAGGGNRLLARKLGIAERTVKAHLTSITRKLKLGSRVETTLLSREVFADQQLMGLYDPKGQ